MNTVTSSLGSSLGKSLGPPMVDDNEESETLSTSYKKAKIQI
jgi:hypothetical protein